VGALLGLASKVPNVVGGFMKGDAGVDTLPAIQS
jgi:hypothetical protein